MIKLYCPFQPSSVNKKFVKSSQFYNFFVFSKFKFLFTFVKCSVIIQDPCTECLVSVLNVVPKKTEKQVCNVYTFNLFYFVRYTLKGYQQLLFKVFKKI